MKKISITVTSVILILISIINISALDNLQFYGTSFSEKEKQEFWQVLHNHDMVSGAYDNSKLFWKYNSNNKYYELSIKDKYGYRVTLNELGDAIYNFGDYEGYEKVKPWILKYYPDTNVVSNKTGKVVSVFGNPIYVGGEFKSGGTTSGGGAGRKQDYYTEPSSTETFESWELFNNLPPEMIAELMDQGLTEEEIREYVWIINNYTTGDTVKDSVFNYEDNTYYDITNDFHYNIDDYNIYYNDDRNIYNVTNNEYNYYITYNITHVSYTYFEPVHKQIITSKHYYKLPDGRNSADLTPDDILGLTLDFDVIRYEKSAVDTVTKGLYHFEGNYKDSSYYENDINVFKGTPSYTFYDMGTYLDSALYLGHNEQTFYINMKHANISRDDDFTLSFKYYVEPSPVNYERLLSVLFGSEAFADNGYSSVSINNYWTKTIRFTSKQIERISVNSYGTKNYSETTLVSKDVLQGQWNEITIEKYNSSINVYVNGELQKSLAFTESKLHNQNLGCIGFITKSDLYQYIDEVRIVSEALYMGENYIPQFTPYDTNRVLSLPDIDKDNVIAVQTELDINGYRIGGVRPTFPEKGFVYFYVENDRIMSTQIYNGYAWEQVKSRIKLHGKWLNPEDYSLTGVGDEFDSPQPDTGVGDSETIIKESGWSFGGLVSKLLGGLIDIVLEIVKSLITLVTDLIGRLFTSLLNFISISLSNISSLVADIGQVPTLINGIFGALPVEIQTFIVGGISLILLIAVIKFLI